MRPFTEFTRSGIEGFRVAIRGKELLDELHGQDKVRLVARALNAMTYGIRKSTFTLMCPLLCWTGAALLLLSSCSSQDATPWYTYQIVNTFPHDRGAFTQGLVFDDGFLYESTGLNGNSSLRKEVLETGEVIKIHALPGQYFGEGITIFQDKIVQLTWRSRTGFVYDKESFDLLQQFAYQTEGWGITHDGKRLIMSTGSSTLFFLDPLTFERNGQINVFDQNGPIGLLNELEYIQGEIYANIWKTDNIVRINPLTGRVTGWITLKGLLSAEDYAQPVDVLNGIAYDRENDRMFVTGKLWPKLFEIKCVPLH